MKNCKFCNAELNENSSVCPACGKDNAKGKKLSVGRTLLAVAAVVVVAVMLVAVVANGRTASADGNPNDVTCKGSYTAPDEVVIAARDTIVATVGDAELTVGQLQVLYWLEVRGFMSYNGAYAAYLGLDISQPLDTQICGVSETPITWQQYFLDSALETWAIYSSMSALSFGVTMDQIEEVNNAYDNFEANAASYGFESGDDMFHADMSNAAEFEDYQSYMLLYFEAHNYMNERIYSINPTADEDERAIAYIDIFNEFRDQNPPTVKYDAIVLAIAEIA